MIEMLPVSLLKRVLLTLLASLILSLGLLRGQGGGCECTNCPQFMPDLFVGPFFINVQNASNPTLGQGGQGVCGVVLHFDHTAICDISITLTSPSGQVVTLVGPIGQFCTSNGNAGTTWDVTFLPCGEPVSPDPGFANTWNNNQPWGGGNAYTGSYYPFNGCLQNFTGPVNGTWTLTVTDGQANDVGNLVDYEIIFCDPSGINCFSCAANAGNLLQNDLVACQGDPALDLTLPPTYTAPNVAPPAAEYGYTYVVGGAGGIIQGYEPDADLSGYPAGTYTVCGMSFLLATEGNIPAPNGALTISQLSTQLNSSQPPFCGKITNNCVNVTIKPLPPDEEEYQTICAPECFSFHNQDYCQTGTYSQTLMQNGCPYTATLYLTVNPPSFKTINETICPDGCSTTPGFAGACGAGQYTETFVNALGCDSVVVLNLINMNVAANISPNPPPQLNCIQTTATLQGTGSSTGPGVSYLWTASNGGAFSGPVNTINATITATGSYHLRVCRTVGLITCCDSASVVVTGSQTLPPAPTAVLGPAVLCPGQSTTFSVTPVSGATSYAWTVPSGASISAGQGSATITVIWGNNTGDVCVAAANACGPGGQTCLTVSVAALDNPGTPQGPGIVCQGDTLDYSIAAVPGVTNYLWAVTPPAQILSGQGSPTVAVLWGNTAAGNLCVALSNGCDTSQSSCIPVQINAQPAQPDLAGDTTLCAGANGNYTIPALANATDYTWTLPPGASILSGQQSTNLQVAWAAAPGGLVCVTASNACGNGPQDCLPVTVYAVPVAQAGPDVARCDSTLTLSAVPSLGTGAWTSLAGAASFTNLSAPGTGVTVDQPGTYQFVWTETNGICSDADTVQVQFNAAPVIGQVVSVCDPVSQQYTVTFPILGGMAPFTVPGGTVQNDTFVSNPIPGGQPYNFQVTDAKGCVSPLVSGLVECNCTSDAGQMGAPLLSACPGDSVTAQQQGGALDGDDTGAYILHTYSGPALGTILAENTNGTFSFGLGMSYGVTYYISYVVGNVLNGLPDLSDPCLSVAAGQAVVFYNNPVANAGMDVAGCGLSLTATGQPGAATGVWTLTGLPPGGTAVLADPLAASTQLTATQFGTYTLTYTVSENACTGTDQVELTFQASPTAGAVVRVCDGTNQQYTVSFPILGGTAPYQVNGVPVTGSSFVSAPMPSGSSFQFTITDANDCASTALSGTFNCNCATSAGQVDLSLIQACAGDTIVLDKLGGQNLDTNDTLSYVLHTGAGPALGVVLAQNHTGQFTFLPGMTYGVTYYMSIAAGNNLNGFPDPADPCFSVAQGQPLVFYENPAPNAGPDAAVCGNSTTLAAGNSGFSGAWAQVSGPGAATFSSLHAPASPVSVNSFGTYVFRWEEQNGSCAAADDVAIVFSGLPTITGVSENCNGTNTGYALVFSVNGGTAPFVVSGVSGSFAGNVFTSVELPNNSTYNATVTDANGCLAPALNGSHHCPCTTSAGTMSGTAPEVFCVDQPASVVWNNNAQLDADDVVQFILHNQAGNSAGTVLATGSQPVFAFGPGLQTGVTYYISAIAGNSLAGQVDLNDPCLDIAPGTPVQWKPQPLATLSGDTTICQGSSTLLSIAGTGTFPLTLTYLNGGILPISLQLPGPQAVSVQVSPATTTTYSLLSMSDGTVPLCTQPLSATATVVVHPPVEAGTALAPPEFCAGTSQTLDLASLLSGADPGGQWTETSAQPSLPGAFQAAAGRFQTDGQPAGVYTFRYSVQAQAPCASKSTTVSVILHPVPVADAGPDKTLTCHQPTVTLGGSGNSSGAGISYRWEYQGTSVGNTLQLSTGIGGVYSFWVSNAAGCIDADSLTVAVDQAAPVAQRITVQPVDCFGDRNGRITVDSILSQHPPVLISLNGGPFSQQNQFSPLAPGTYTLTLQDANGCEWTSAPLTVQEPQQVLVDLGPTVNAALGDSVRLSAYSNVPFPALQSVVWQPVWDSLHADTMVQHFRPLHSSRVEIHLVDTSGCAASTSVLVLVDRTRNVFIPNIIKPGSNRNDLLAVFGGPDVEEVESFRIFDRWGEQLFGATHFKANDLSNAWNGTFKGEPVSPGVYVYYAVLRFIDGESAVFRGDVTVYR